MCRDAFIWSFGKQFALLGAEPGDLAGCDEYRAHLFCVNGSGIISSHTDPGFVSIGIGNELAVNELMANG
jgi:hypothetical protein